jgi:flagellar biogenesis protein FliO
MRISTLTAITNQSRDRKGVPSRAAIVVLLASVVVLTTAAATADELAGDQESSDVVTSWLQQNATTAEKPPSPTLKRHKSARPENKQAADSGPVSLPYGKMVWPLAAVLGTIALAAWALRKWSSGVGRLGSTGAITVLARHYLSSKQSLCLVRLGHRVILLGITPDSISAVADFNREETAGLLAGLERARPGSFVNALAGMGPEHAVKSTSDETESPLDDASGRVHNLVERMKTCGAGT